MALDLTKPPFQTERGEPMHFVGHTKDGRTVWEDKEGWVSSRRADGRLHDGGPDGDDVINAPPPKVKETLWAVTAKPGAVGYGLRGWLYASEADALGAVNYRYLNVAGARPTPVEVEVEYTPKEPQ